MKKYRVLLCAFISLFAVFLMYKAIKAKKQPKQLIVGIMSGYAPYALLDASGNLEGFDIDVAREIAKRLNKNIIFQDMNLAPLLIALSQKKLDFVISGLCMTQERLAKMNMIHYQGQPVTQNPLVFWQKIPQGITTIDDFRKYPDAVICVEPGSAQEKYLLQFDFLNLKYTSEMSENVLDLQYGKSLAAFIDPDIFPVMKKKTPELVELPINLPEQFQSKGNGIALTKDNSKLTQEIEKLVQEMKQDGTIATFEEKWFKGE